MGRIRHISLSTKFAIVLGTMVVLLTVELFVLRVSMDTLSAVRSFVFGEALWSKAQKTAAFRLQRYEVTRDEEDFRTFLSQMEILDGIRVARVEMGKDNPNYALGRRNLIRAGIHPDDVAPMVRLFQRFLWEEHLQRALSAWMKADEYLGEFEALGKRYHSLLNSTQGALPKALHTEIVSQIAFLDQKLTEQETNLSRALGEGSRKMEAIVNRLLLLVVLSVEAVGIGFSIYTSRSIVRRLSKINQTAHGIGRGKLSERIEVGSEDELGEIEQAINEMAFLLESSYSNLETRVEERTKELQRALKTAQTAIASRDEFISIASHELKTPLTALYIQLEFLYHLSSKSVPLDPLRVRTLTEGAFKQALRLRRVSDELLDLTQLRLGQLSLKITRSDLVKMVKEAVSQSVKEWKGPIDLVRVTGESELMAEFDVARMGQVLINLVSNALKYGSGNPIEVRIHSTSSQAIVEVEDNGQGISPDRLEKIFERFERGAVSHRISGLGLGLYISKQIIVAHQGEVTVRSKIDQGTTFTICIPLTQSNGLPQIGRKSEFEPCIQNEA